MASAPNYILLDDPTIWRQLLPLTYLRPVSGLRLGLARLSETWQLLLGKSVSFKTEPHLQTTYRPFVGMDNTAVYSHFVPNETLVAAIATLRSGQKLVWQGQVIAFRFAGSAFPADLDGFELVAFQAEALPSVQRPYDLFRLNRRAITVDFERLTRGRNSQPLSTTNTLIGNPSQVFLEPEARVEGAILNTTTGPIYLAADSEVMEGSLIRGPFALGEGATVKMGAKIYGATTIGPHCKVGGEVNNSLFDSYSNKGHDGFLGNSIIGAWCNLGADTNASNLKNNYREVSLWNYALESFQPTGDLFCGLIMGDHSKAGINTMFNTATVCGVAANVFGAAFPPKFIPSFAWGFGDQAAEHDFEKACDTARAMMARRGLTLGTAEVEQLRHIFESTEKFRKL